MILIFEFQSTLPVRGATHLRAGAAHVRAISIHAPRKGSDMARGLLSSLRKKFQSTLPVRGATADQDGAVCDALFQSTLPVRGATSAVCASWLAVIFQSTLPVRGATRARAPHPHIPRVISIHAPRKGSDQQLGHCAAHEVDFNPRSP